MSDKLYIEGDEAREACRVLSREFERHSKEFLNRSGAKVCLKIPLYPIMRECYEVESLDNNNNYCLYIECGLVKMDKGK